MSSPAPIQSLRLAWGNLAPEVRARAGLVAAVAVYAAVFHLSYHTVIMPVFEFWGFGDPPVPWPYLAAAWVLAVLPSLWIPVGLRRPSQLLFMLLYLVLFIPASCVCFYSWKPALPPVEAMALVLAMFAGLAVISGVYFLPLLRLPRFRPRPWMFWLVFGTFAAGLTAYLLVSQRDQIRLASFEQIYELRREMAEHVLESGTRLDFYAVTWLAGFAFPFLFAAGAFRRRWWLCGIALAGEFFLFTVGGYKMTALAVLYLPVMYLLVRGWSRVFPAVLTGGATLLLALGFLPASLLTEPVRIQFLAVVHFRTFSIPSLLIVQYYEFFKSHPLTYLAHVTGINRLIAYPYAVDVPRTLGFQYYGDPNLGSNASFWAGDGLASFGLPGIVILSVFCALVFWLFDSCAREQDPRLAALAVTVIGVTLANVSLFTTLLSGGLLFLMAALLLLPPAEAQGPGAAAAEEGEEGG